MKTGPHPNGQITETVLFYLNDGVLFFCEQNMKNVAADLFPAVGVNVQHKKINLADDFLSWEHERYSIRRLSALTVSHYKVQLSQKITKNPTTNLNEFTSGFKKIKAPKSDYQRGTILDTKSSVDIPALARNVRILAESLASQLYNTSGPFFEGDMVPHW